jgi:hypothetical protein
MLKDNRIDDNSPTMNHHVGWPTDLWGAIVLPKRLVDNDFAKVP